MRQERNDVAWTTKGVVGLERSGWFQRYTGAEEMASEACGGVENEASLGPGRWCHSPGQGTQKGLKALGEGKGER